MDECHRTQSGKLHQAMKLILPDATFIGFAGTPLMKKDKEKYLWGQRYRLDVRYSNMGNQGYLTSGKLILQVRKESTLS